MARAAAADPRANGFWTLIPMKSLQVAVDAFLGELSLPVGSLVAFVRVQNSLLNSRKISPLFSLWLTGSSIDSRLVDQRYRNVPTLTPAIRLRSQIGRIYDSSKGPQNKATGIDRFEGDSRKRRDYTGLLLVGQRSFGSRSFTLGPLQRPNDVDPLGEGGMSPPLLAYPLRSINSRRPYFVDLCMIVNPSYWDRSRIAGGQRRDVAGMLLVHEPAVYARAVNQREKSGDIFR